MKIKFYTELYADMPEGTRNDLVKTLKSFDKYLRDNLLDNSKYVTDSSVNIDEILIVDYEIINDSELKTLDF